MLDQELINEITNEEREGEAETEQQSHISIKMRERSNRRNKIKNYVTKNKAIFDFRDFDSDEDQLGNDSNYQLQRKELSLQERENQEEAELTYAIEKMNLERREDSLENNDSDNDDDGDDIDDINIEHHDYLKYKERKTSLTDSNYTKDSLSNTILPENQIQRECFISQNIVNYDQLLKIIVIGKTRAGKSLFIQKLLQQDSSNPTLTFDYNPTTIFEINKTTISLKINYRVNLELWDTCSTVANSEVIKTYYKLANAFILIVDINEEEGKCDISFISKQIERIYSISSEDPKLFLLINTKGMRYDMANDIKLSELVSKYYLQVKTCDISTVQMKTDEEFIIYLNKITRTKKLSFEKTMKNKYHSTGNTPWFKNAQHKSLSNPPRKKANMGLFEECKPFDKDEV